MIGLPDVVDQRTLKKTSYQIGKLISTCAK